MAEKERFINTIKKSLSGLLPLHMADGVAERAADALIQDGAVFHPVQQIPKKVRIGEPSSVKAFDGENKILTYRCYPCPTCSKWIIDNENHKYCQWCGQALDWSDHPTEKGGGSDA